MKTERNTTKLPCGARPCNPHTPHGAALTNDLPAACRHFVPAAALCKGNQKQASVKRTVCDTRGGLTRRVSIENSPPISGLKLGIADFYGCFQATSARKSELLQNLKLGKAIWNKRGTFLFFLLFSFSCCNCKRPSLHQFTAPLLSGVLLAQAVAIS